MDSLAAFSESGKFPKARAVGASALAPTGPGFLRWRLYLKLSDIIDPGPSQTLLFWDEREDAINLGNFFVDMTGFQDQPGAVQFNFDWPGSYHHLAGGLSFVDGHAEIKRWRDAGTTPPLNTLPLGRMSSPGNQDLIWLQEHATRRL